MTDVPFERTRTASFRVMLASLAAAVAVVILMDGPVADDLTILLLCVCAACVLTARLLFYWSQKGEMWRLARCESELNRHTDRITGFDNAIMAACFPEDPSPLYVVGSAAPDHAREATSGSARVAEVLAFERPEWTR